MTEQRSTRARKSVAPSVLVADLPEFTKVEPYADVVAAALDEMARQFAGGGEQDDPRNPIATAQANMLRHAAEQTRKFVRTIPTTSTAGEQQ